MPRSPGRLWRSGKLAVSHAVERRRHPERFIRVDLTPKREIFRDGIMSVQHYSLPADQPVIVDGESLPVNEQRHPLPVILVPALGIHGWTFDIMPERSMVRYLLARGFEVYLVDWGQPSQSDREISLDTYVNRWLPAAVEAVNRDAGSDRASLLGYCMGGLLCLMYLGAWREAPVRNLVTLASPVNFHKSGPFGRLAGLASIPAMKLHNWFSLRLEPLDANTFHIPGRLLSLGFKLTNPPGVVSAYLDLVRNITDREYVSDYMTMGHWFNDMVDYPGSTVRELIEKMLIANSLAGGRINIGNRVADFSRVGTSLLALAGATDKIVSIQAARDILRITGGQDKHFRIVPGGHAGILAGSKAPQYTWKIAADWLEERLA